MRQPGQGVAHVFARQQDTPDQNGLKRIPLHTQGPARGLGQHARMQGASAMAPRSACLRLLDSLSI